MPVRTYSSGMSDAAGVRGRLARQPGRAAARRGAGRGRRGLPAQVLRAHLRLPPRRRHARLRLARPRRRRARLRPGRPARRRRADHRRAAPRTPSPPITAGSRTTAAEAGGTDGRRRGATRGCGATGRSSSRSRRLLGPDGPSDRFVSGDPLTIEMEVEARRPGAHAELRHQHQLGRRGALLRDQHAHRRAGGRRAERPRHGELHDPGAAAARGLASRCSSPWSRCDESQVHHWLDRWLEFDVFPRVTGIGPGEHERRVERRRRRSDRSPPGRRVPDRRRAIKFRGSHAPTTSPDDSSMLTP